MWGEYIPPEGGQESISLGYKTCTSVNLFDILVIGMDVSAESSVFLYVLRSKTTGWVGGVIRKTLRSRFYWSTLNMTSPSQCSCVSNTACSLISGTYFFIPLPEVPNLGTDFFIPFLSLILGIGFFVPFLFCKGSHHKKMAFFRNIPYS